MSDMIEILRDNPLLQNISQDTLQTLLPHLERTELKNGETLFEKGDPGDSYYIVESGTIKISNNELELSQLTTGQGFGEMSLLGGYPRSATAQAATGSALIRVSRTGFFHLIEAHPELVERFNAMMDSMVRRSLFATAFKYFIGELDESVTEDIENDLIWETYAPGDVILRQGVSGDDLLFIASGRVRTTYRNGGDERTLGEVGTGSVVGELALLSETTRSATVTAVRETTVARMNQTILKKIMQKNPEFALSLIKTISERQQRNFDHNHVEKPVYLHLGLLPTQDGLDTIAFAEMLKSHLETHGKALILNRARFEELYGVEGITDYLESSPISQVIQVWLNELERQYDYVLYIPDADWTIWTNWVMRKVDRVLLVGEAARGHEPGTLERTAIQKIGQLHYELVILHEKDTRQPSKTAAWLGARDLYRHHHIRKEDGAHFARLARLLTGNGVGLVLSGGGARGYAHIGVIKALMEAQIPIDAIGCVSMGAVVGGALHRFMDYEDIRTKATQLGSRKALLDVTFPVSALMRSKKVTDAMAALYEDFNIEDGWLSFFCISTNLTKARINIHKRGKMKDSVRASLSIPGVFSPVIRNEDLVVDGGVLNNFPVDVMRQFLEGGLIIGSLIAGSEGKGRAYAIDDHLNGWKLFFSGLIPGMKRQRVPSVVKVIMGTTSISGIQSAREARERTDLLLQTDTYPVGTLDFDKHEELTRKGYETHRETLQQWKEDHLKLIDGPPLWKEPVS